MRRLIGLVGTVVVLLAWTSCGGEERREFAPEDRVGTEVDVNAQPLIDSQDCLFAAQAHTACPMGGGDDDNHRGIEILNRVRLTLGTGGPAWGCANPSDSMRIAATRHATYNRYYSDQNMTNCTNDGHVENPACSLQFTGVHPTDRVLAAGGFPAGAIAGAGEIGDDARPGLSPEASMCGLFFQAPYHHVILLRSESNYVGYGYNEGRFQFGFESRDNYWDLADGNGAPSNRAYWPVPGSSGNRRGMDAHNESPTPPACAGGWPCGSLASIRIPNSTVTGTAFCKKEANGTCTHVPHIALTHGTQPDHVPEDSAMLYSHTKLLASTVYRVQFFANVCGLTTPTGFPLPCQDQSPWWEFMTGSNSY